MTYVPVWVMRVKSKELLVPSGPSSFSATVDPSDASSVTIVSKLSELKINRQIITFFQLHHVIAGESTLTGGNVSLSDSVSETSLLAGKGSGLYNLLT